MATDFTNPCAVLDQLRQAHIDLVTGKAVASVSYDGRTVSYSRTEVGALEKMITRYEALCQAATDSTKPKRYAIRTGGM